MRLILLGAPGAGKGTVASMVQYRFQLVTYCVVQFVMAPIQVKKPRAT